MKRDIYLLSRDHLSDERLNVPGLVSILVLEKVVRCPVAEEIVFLKSFCLVISEPDDEKKEG